tara:strand:- start:4854 stop:5414 length:561 start_codon:yes stop_codon:yes gene_type:complete
MKLNLGCGWRNFGSEWVHIDNGDYKHLDYKSDITTLPMIRDSSVDLIYASHVIAYFDKNEIIDVFNEWKRILKCGGILRLATPDFQSICNLYNNLHKNNIKLNDIIGPLYGKMDMDGKYIYHKIIYDFNSLKYVLETCGFLNIKKYEWRDTEHAHFDDHSQAYIPHMDKDGGKLISLNVECEKNEY